MNHVHTFGLASLLHVLFARSFVDLKLESKWDNIGIGARARALLTEFACGLKGGFGRNKCYLPFLQIAGFAGVNEFRARVGQTDIWEFKLTYHLCSDATT